MSNSTAVLVLACVALTACSGQPAKEQTAAASDQAAAAVLPLQAATAEGVAMPAAAVAGFKPGFDCARATLKVETVICGNARLARLDTELTRVYGLAGKAPGVDRAQLQRLQGGWLNTRNACAGAQVDTTVCLTEAYAGRIADLRAGYASANDDAGMSLGPILWHCDGRADLFSTYFNDVDGGDDTFVYLKWNGRGAVLNQAVSASGARYEGHLNDGDYEFWTKGNETMFSVPGSVGINCTEAS